MGLGPRHGLRIILIIGVVLGGIVGVAPRAEAAGPSGPGCFTETDRCITGRFLAYWQANGGLAQFGFPLTGEQPALLEDGKTYTVQYFERARFELHPENAPPPTSSSASSGGASSAATITAMPRGTSWRSPRSRRPGRAASSPRPATTWANCVRIRTT